VTSAHFFKAKISKYLKQTETGIKTCFANTPFTGRYEIERLTFRTAKLNSKLRTKWFIFYLPSRQLVEEFFKLLFVNLDNNPLLVIQQKKPVEEDAEHIPKSKHSSSHLKTSFNKSLIEEEVEQLMEEVEAFEILHDLGQNINEFSSAEEKNITAFLKKHVDINNRRMSTQSELIERMKTKKVAELKMVVNTEGLLGKYIRFEGETEWNLMRVDAEGNQVVSRGVSEKWYYSQPPELDETKKAIGILKSNPKPVEFTRLAMKNVALLAGSCAFGEFLYGMVEGKQDMKKLAKTLVIDTRDSLALTLLLGTMPHVMIAVASVMGVKALHDLSKNRLIKTKTKIKLMSGLIVKVGTSTAISIGGAIIGQTLIPIPILGSFIGGVIGGFSAAAFFGSYDKLIAKRVSLELMALYLLLVFRKQDHYFALRFNEQSLQADHEFIETFTKNISVVCGKSNTVDYYSGNLVRRIKDIEGIIEDLYTTVGEPLKNKNLNIDSTFETVWKSLLGFCFLSYFYTLVQTELEVRIEEGFVKEEDSLECIHRIEEMMDLAALTGFLSKRIELFGEFRVLDRLITVVNEYLKSYKLVTLIKQVARKHEVAEKEKQETWTDLSLTN
jgi:hypothetical protein